MIKSERIDSFLFHVVVNCNVYNNLCANNPSVCWQFDTLKKYSDCNDKRKRWKDARSIFVAVNHFDFASFFQGFDRNRIKDFPLN